MYAIRSYYDFIAHELTNVPDMGVNYLYLLYPFVGILLAVIFVRFFIKDDIGHGVSKILYSISRKSGKLKPHKMYSSMRNNFVQHTLYEVIR